MPAVVLSPGAALLAAKKRVALSDTNSIDRLYLNPVAKGIPGLDVASKIVKARVLLTLEGASSLTVSINDPDWLIEESGILDVGDDGRMDAIDVALDRLFFRLVKASRRSGDVLDLTFESLAVALMREHNKHRVWSRGKFTRAGAIETMVREIKDPYIPFFSPEKGLKMPTHRPDYPTTAPSQGETGFADGTSIKIKGFDGGSWTLGRAQLANAATVIGVADQLNAGQKATKALVEACIVEPGGFQGSGPFDNPAGGDSSSVGILQLLDIHLGGSASTHGGRRDVGLVARLFLTKGFRGLGGAIDLAKQHPEWTAGEVGQGVQGSGFPGRYDSVGESADKVIAAYKRGDQSAAQSDTVLSTVQYQFTRGLPGKKENSWEAATRLAEEVNWRIYEAGGVIAFNRDRYLIRKPAALVLDDPMGEGLISRPSYDWDHGKLAGQVELDVHATRWSLAPGDVVSLSGSKWGPIRGDWLTLEIDQNLLVPTDCTVTLTKPIEARLEPAAQIIQRSTGATPVHGSSGGSVSPDALGGAKAAIRWAQSKIGHYKESLGMNHGPELDILIKSFPGFVPGPRSPWCAMFATTAVAQGAGDQCKTPSVGQIVAWAQAGTHGYERGLKATPRPGDLICEGAQHVVFVERVVGTQYHCIQGNGSAGQVDRRIVGPGFGSIFRPDYRT